MIVQGLQTLFGLHMWFGVSGFQNDFSKACQNHLASFCAASGPGPEKIMWPPFVVLGLRPPNFSKAGKNIWPPFVIEDLKPPKKFSKACKHHLASFCGLGSQAPNMISSKPAKIIWPHFVVRGPRPPKMKFVTTSIQHYQYYYYHYDDYYND